MNSLDSRELGEKRVLSLLNLCFWLFSVRKHIIFVVKIHGLNFMLRHEVFINFEHQAEPFVLK